MEKENSHDTPLGAVSDSTGKADAARADSAQKKPKHIETAGEKKFNRLTYNGIGYIANALISVAAVHWVERTPSGQDAMGAFVNWAKKTFPKFRPERVEHLATKTFFLSGGFAVLAPMKWLEDAKVRLVKKWDKQYYGDAVETDPTIVQSHKELEAAPKQNWKSIGASRVLALVPFYITVGALWDRGSLLSRLTNKELGNVRKEATEAYFHKNPGNKSWFKNLFNDDLHFARSEALEAFMKKSPKDASKGIYFDRAISWVSRKIGKLFSSGEAEKKISAMEESHPGHIVTKTNGDGTHDSNRTSTPYYVISEAITSGMVAWGVYVLTRILGPIMGKKVAPSRETLPIAAAAPVIDQKVEERPLAEELAQRPEINPPESYDEHHAKQEHTHAVPHTKVHHVQHERHHDVQHAAAV